MLRRFALLVPVAAVVIAAVPLPRPDDASQGVITLRAFDDMQASFDFDAGEFATRVEDGELILDDAEIVFDLLAPGMLSVGFRKKELVRLVDIGDERVGSVSTPRDIAPKPRASVYDTLEVNGNKVVCRAPVNKTLRLEAGERVFGNFPAEGAQHFEPVIGHVYVMRWVGPLSDRVERLVKFRVVGYELGESVTLRWARL